MQNRTRQFSRRLEKINYRLVDTTVRICYTELVLVFRLKPKEEVICMCINTKKRNKDLLHAKPADCDGCME